MAGEAWQLALPFLDGAGLDANDLWNELQRAPSQVVAQFTIAVSATALLVLTGHGAFWLGRCALGLTDSPLPRRLAGAGAFALTSLVGVAGAMLGGVRHTSNAAGNDLASAFGSGSGAIPPAIFQLLAAGLPFLSACLAEWLAGLVKRRGAILAQVRAAARTLATRQAERAALEERIQLADREVDRLLLERAGQEGTVLRLGCLGEQASRAAAEEAWLEGEALARAREDLRAALEVDRFAFLKAAGRAGHTGLWSADGVVTLLSPAPCAAPSAQEAA